MLGALFLSLSKPQRKRLLSNVPIFLLLVVAINGPLWARNLSLSGSPLGFSSPFGDLDKAERIQYRTRHITVSGVLSNIVRNSILHLGTPFPSVNRVPYEVSVSLIRALGHDPNDNDWLESGRSNDWRFGEVSFSLHESEAGNALHFAVYCAVFIMAVVGWKSLSKEILLYSAGLIVAYVSFCGLIRWMPFNARLHMPVFVCAAALTGAVLGKYFERCLSLFAGMGLLFLAAALPFVIANKARPLVPVARHQSGQGFFPTHSILATDREHLYYGDEHMRFADAEIAAARSVRSTNCTDIGLDAALDDYEYPIMALLLDDGIFRRIRYVGINNRSLRYARKDSSFPCVIVCLNCTGHPERLTLYEGHSFQQEFFGNTAVIRPGF
jgi:hypothetical protein